MRKLYITLLAAIFALPAFSIHVAIIESQSVVPGQSMDVNWQASAIALGYTAEILPQSTLDNISNLIGADILVVASGRLTYNHRIIYQPCWTLFKVAVGFIFRQNIPQCNQARSLFKP